MQRIRSSLAAKTFLLVFCTLTICSMIIYAVIAIALPKRYLMVTNTQASDDIEELTQWLEGVSTESAKNLIYNYCIENRACALLRTGTETFIFGDADEQGDANNTFTFTSVVMLSDQGEGCILTVTALESADAGLRNTILTLIPTVLSFMIVISGICAWICSKSIVRPVLQICGVSKRMAQLDMTWRCDDGRSDELGVLSGNLNMLSERLTQAMTALEEANDKLKQDVETTHLMEKQRRDFFSAASHELKTPVTVLKGQLESMAMGIGDYKNHAKYLPQAITTVENMEALIKEILSISKMEMGIPTDAFTEENLGLLVSECIGEVAPLAVEKQSIIQYEMLDEITAFIYKPLFKKAITNILMNAVKYSPNGETIAVTVTHEKIVISNSGVTIPIEDIPYLFTPFYRTEKSRNRQNGGSGLGLYIVKTIFDLHGIGCRIDNIGNGVNFTILLNQN